MNKPHVRPVGTQIAVLPIYQERVGTPGLYLDTRMSGGVALPDIVDDEPIEGIVQALGDGFIDACPTCYPNGKRYEFTVKVGDTVLFPVWRCSSIVLDDEEWFLIDEQDLCGIRSS